MNYFIDGMNVFTNIIPGNLTSLAAISISGAYFLDEYLSFKYWKNIFKNCGLYNSDKKFPALINKLKNEIGTQFIFSLPPGICLSDIENRKEELETALNEPIKCDLTNNYKLVIQTYHLEYEKEYSLPNINTPANKLLFHTGVTCGSRIKSL